MTSTATSDHSANNLREGEIIQLTGIESGIYLVTITIEQGASGVKTDWEAIRSQPRTILFD